MPPPSIQREVIASPLRSRVFQGVPIRPYANVSPRVRALQRAQKAVPSDSRRPATDSTVKPWSSDMINAASKAGNLPIAPLSAELLLKNIANLKQNGQLSKAGVEKLMEGMFTL